MATIVEPDAAIIMHANRRRFHMVMVLEPLAEPLIASGNSSSPARFGSNIKLVVFAPGSVESMHVDVHKSIAHCLVDA